MLPNFVIIGAARSGTTSLYHALVEHPDIYMPLKKELQFFSANWEQGIKWYRKFFESHTNENAVGEASVSYTYPMYQDVIAGRIARTVPSSRLIYMIRNPIERTYSHYLYYKFYGQKESRDFEHALRSNPVYLSTSNYHSWIERYRAHFSRQQLLVVLFDDYVENPIDTIQSIYRFIGVSDDFIPKNAKRKTNAGFRPRSMLLYTLYRYVSTSRLRFLAESLLPQSYRPIARNTIHRILGVEHKKPIMSSETKAWLHNYFHPEIQKLEGYLNRDLRAWEE